MSTVLTYITVFSDYAIHRNVSSTLAYVSGMKNVSMQVRMGLSKRPRVAPHDAAPKIKPDMNEMPTKLANAH